MLCRRDRFLFNFPTSGLPLRMIFLFVRERRVGVLGRENVGVGLAVQLRRMGQVEAAKKRRAESHEPRLAIFEINDVRNVPSITSSRPLASTCLAYARLSSAPAAGSSSTPMLTKPAKGGSAGGQNGRQYDGRRHQQLVFRVRNRLVQRRSITFRSIFGEAVHDRAPFVGNKPRAR